MENSVLIQADFRGKRNMRGDQPVPEWFNHHACICKLGSGEPNHFLTMLAFAF